VPRRPAARPAGTRLPGGRRTVGLSAPGVRGARGRPCAGCASEGPSRLHGGYASPQCLGATLPMEGSQRQRGSTISRGRAGAPVAIVGQRRLLALVEEDVSSCHDLHSRGVVDVRHGRERRVRDVEVLGSHASSTPTTPPATASSCRRSIRRAKVARRRWDADHPSTATVRGASAGAPGRPVPPRAGAPSHRSRDAPPARAGRDRSGATRAPRA
jgi:hypothetical protein